MTKRLYLLLALAAALLALTVVGLNVDAPALAGKAHVARLGLLVVLLCASAIVYFSAVLLVLRFSWLKKTVWVVLAAVAPLRLALLAAPPMLSTDIYRYVWDGRVQAAGINPYRYVPADPALQSLRDAAVYPHINRKEYARTIYPPVAEMVFGLAGRLWDSVSSFRLTALVSEALGVAALVGLLPLAGMPRERILIYAWNPLALWPFASDGHVDAIAVGLVGLALLLRARHRDGWAGAALAGAVMAKFLPVVVAPAFLRGGRFWRPVVAALAVIVGSYAVYIGAGWHVLGFLPAYGSEEGFDSGSGLWLLAGLGNLAPLPASASALYGAAVVVIFMALSVAILRRPTPANDAHRLRQDTGTLAAVTMVAISAHYHWYFTWLVVLPAVVAPSAALLWLATAPLLLIIGPIPHDRFIWPSLIYVPAAALLLVELRRRRALPRPLPAETGEVSCPLQSR
jgi:alpha-1,6-mannosyltransferase